MNKISTYIHPPTVSYKHSDRNSRSGNLDFCSFLQLFYKGLSSIRQNFFEYTFRFICDRLAGHKMLILARTDPSWTYYKPINILRHDSRRTSAIIFSTSQDSIAFVFNKEFFLSKVSRSEIPDTSVLNKKYTHSLFHFSECCSGNRINRSFLIFDEIFCLTIRTRNVRNQ